MPTWIKKALEREATTKQQALLTMPGSRPVAFFHRRCNRTEGADNTAGLHDRPCCRLRLRQHLTHTGPVPDINAPTPPPPGIRPRPPQSVRPAVPPLSIIVSTCQLGWFDALRQPFRPLQGLHACSADYSCAQGHSQLEQGLSDATKLALSAGKCLAWPLRSRSQYQDRPLICIVDSR